MLTRPRGRHLVQGDDAHAFLGYPLQAEQTDAELVLDEFADGADAAVAQMVDIVGMVVAVIDRDDLLDDGHDVFAGQGPVFLADTLPSRLSRRLTL